MQFDNRLILSFKEMLRSISCTWGFRAVFSYDLLRYVKICNSVLFEVVFFYTREEKLCKLLHGSHNTVCIR